MDQQATTNILIIKEYKPKQSSFYFFNGRTLCKEQIKLGSCTLGMDAGFHVFYSAGWAGAIFLSGNGIRGEKLYEKTIESPDLELEIKSLNKRLKETYLKENK